VFAALPGLCSARNTLWGGECVRPPPQQRATTPGEPRRTSSRVWSKLPTDALVPAAPIFTILSAHLSPLSVSLHSEKVCGKKSISWVGPSTISGSWPNLIIDLFANLIAIVNLIAGS